MVEVRETLPGHRICFPDWSFRQKVKSLLLVIVVAVAIATVSVALFS